MYSSAKSLSRAATSPCFVPCPIGQSHIDTYEYGCEQSTPASPATPAGAVDSGDTADEHRRGAGGQPGRAPPPRTETGAAPSNAIKARLLFTARPVRRGRSICGTVQQQVRPCPASREKITGRDGRVSKTDSGAAHNVNQTRVRAFHGPPCRRSRRRAPARLRTFAPPPPPANDRATTRRGGAPAHRRRPAFSPQRRHVTHTCPVWATSTSNGPAAVRPFSSSAGALTVVTLAGFDCPTASFIHVLTSRAPAGGPLNSSDVKTACSMIAFGERVPSATDKPPRQNRDGS